MLKLLFFDDFLVTLTKLIELKFEIFEHVLFEIKCLELSISFFFNLFKLLLLHMQNAIPHTPRLSQLLLPLFQSIISYQSSTFVKMLSSFNIHSNPIDFINFRRHLLNLQLICYWIRNFSFLYALDPIWFKILHLPFLFQ